MSSCAPTRCAAGSSGPGTTPTTDLRAIVADPNFRQAHEVVPAAKPGGGGAARSTSRAVATAKLNDARSLDEACSWLKPKERLAVLNDRALISMLVRLSATPEASVPADNGRDVARRG